MCLVLFPEHKYVWHRTGRTPDVRHPSSPPMDKILLRRNVPPRSVAVDTQSVHDRITRKLQAFDEDVARAAMMLVGMARKRQESQQGPKQLPRMLSFTPSVISQSEDESPASSHSDGDETDDYKTNSGQQRKSTKKIQDEAGLQLNLLRSFQLVSLTILCSCHCS